MRFAPLLLTKLFCDVINRERGREGAEKTQFLGNFLPLTLIVIWQLSALLNKIALIWGAKDLVTKRHSYAKYNSNRTKGNVQFYVGQGFKVSLPFSSWASLSGNCIFTFFSVALKLILQLVKQRLRFFFCLIFDRDVLIGSLSGFSQWQSFSLLRFEVSLSRHQVSVTSKISLRVKQFCALS